MRHKPVLIKQKFAETDLAKVFVDFFEAKSYNVYKEVPIRGKIVDILVEKEGIITIIETKMIMGLAVIEQAHRNLDYAHYSFCAVPKTTNEFALKICKDYGIGVLVCDLNHSDLPIYEYVAASYNAVIRKPVLKDWMTRSIAGSRNERMTSWKVFIESAEFHLEENGPLDHKELFELCYRHYGSSGALRRNLIQNILQKNINTIEYINGKFQLA
jgi:hypothetical protein